MRTSLSVKDIAATACVFLLPFAASVIIQQWSHGLIQQLFGRALTLILLVATLPVMLISAVELLLPPIGPRKPPKIWLLNVQINIILSVSFIVAGAILAVTFAAASKHFNLGYFDVRLRGGSGAVALIGMLVVRATVVDFFYYWYHRAMHVVPALWRIHKLHHLDERMDASTVGRQNWVDAFVEVLLIVAPMAVLFRFKNVSYTEMGVAGAAIMGVLPTWTAFYHANIKLGFGRASAFIQSPQVHRIHHSRLPQHQNRNFAIYSPIWDVLFGTYYAPAKDEYPPTGVAGEKDIGSLAEAELLPFREWWTMFRLWLHRRVQIGN